MSRVKWIVKAEYTTKKEMEKRYRKNGRDPDEYGLEDFHEMEIAIVREDNKHGMRSCGWGDENKIILCESEGPSDYDEEDVKWFEEAAKTMCEALNKKGL